MIEKEQNIVHILNLLLKHYLVHLAKGFTYKKILAPFEQCKNVVSLGENFNRFAMQVLQPESYVFSAYGFNGK